MSRAAIVYFSQAGSTARVAERISAGLGSAGYNVDTVNLIGGPTPHLAGCDLLGIGLPAYYFRPPFAVTDYIEALPALDGLPAFVFVTYGTYRGDAGNLVRAALAGKGAREVGYHTCRGADYFLGYLWEGYHFSPDHPTEADLDAAEVFGAAVAARVAGAAYARPELDPPVGFIYRMERLFLSRPLARQMYSRLFRVNRDACTACGICVANCPTSNIAEDDAGRPRWGRDCLFCLACEAGCPEDAITSPLGWPVFRVFMRYNVRGAARDPAISHARVRHAGGQTQRL